MILNGLAGGFNHLEKYERQLGLLLMFSMVNDF